MKNLKKRFWFLFLLLVVFLGACTRPVPAQEVATPSFIPATEKEVAALYDTMLAPVSEEMEILLPPRETVAAVMQIPLGKTIFAPCVEDSAQAAKSNPNAENLGQRYAVMIQDCIIQTDSELPQQGVELVRTLLFVEIIKAPVMTPGIREELLPGDRILQDILNGDHPQQSNNFITCWKTAAQIFSEGVAATDIENQMLETEYALNIGICVEEALPEFDPDIGTKA